MIGEPPNFCPAAKTAAKDGYKFRRQSWVDSEGDPYIQIWYYNPGSLRFELWHGTNEDFTATDWEVIEET